MYNLSPFSDLKHIRKIVELPQSENLDDIYYCKQMNIFVTRVEKKPSSDIIDTRYKQRVDLYASTINSLLSKHRNIEVFLGRFRTKLTADLEARFPSVKFIYGEVK